LFWPTSLGGSIDARRFRLAHFELGAALKGSLDCEQHSIASEISNVLRLNKPMIAL